MTSHLRCRPYLGERLCCLVADCPSLFFVDAGVEDREDGLERSVAHIFEILLHFLPLSRRRHPVRVRRRLQRHRHLRGRHHGNRKRRRALVDKSRALTDAPRALISTSRARDKTQRALADAESDQNGVTR